MTAATGAPYPPRFLTGSYFDTTFTMVIKRMCFCILASLAFPSVVAALVFLLLFPAAGVSVVCDSNMQHCVSQGQQGVQNHLWQWGLRVHFNSCFPAPGVLMLVLGHLHSPPRTPRALSSPGSGSRDSYGRTVLSLLYQHLGHGLPASGLAPGAAAASMNFFHC